MTIAVAFNCWVEKFVILVTIYVAIAMPQKHDRKAILKWVKAHNACF